MFQRFICFLFILSFLTCSIGFVVFHCLLLFLFFPSLPLSLIFPPCLFAYLPLSSYRPALSAFCIAAIRLVLCVSCTAIVLFLIVLFLSGFVLTALKSQKLDRDGGRVEVEETPIVQHCFLHLAGVLDEVNKKI